jgi:hypothetical protein
VRLAREKPSAVIGQMVNCMSILLGLLVAGHRFHLDGCDRRGLRRHCVILGRYTPNLQSFRHVENQPRGEGPENR